MVCILYLLQLFLNQLISSYTNLHISLR